MFCLGVPLKGGISMRSSIRKPRLGIWSSSFFVGRLNGGGGGGGRGGGTDASARVKTRGVL